MDVESENDLSTFTNFYYYLSRKAPWNRHADVSASIVHVKCQGVALGPISLI